MSDEVERAQVVMLTGATGFLGSAVAKELMTSTSMQVLAIVRPRGRLGARERLERLWHDEPTLAREIGGRVIPLAGDVTRERLGLSSDDSAYVCNHADMIVHAAANVDINETYETLCATNVVGTARVLELAEAMPRLRRLVHVSTAYVVGRRHGRIDEDSLVDAGFNSLYERTKFEAERLVRAAAGRGIPIHVIRPTQIVGDSRTGYITTFNTLYYPLKLYLKGQLPVIPIRREQRLNVVPVDYVARLVAAALESDVAGLTTVHATMPAADQPTAGELVEAVRAWAKAELALDLVRPRFVSLPLAGGLGTRRNLRETEGRKPKGTVRNLLALAPYFDDGRDFACQGALALAGPCEVGWREFLPRLLRHAVGEGFLNHTGRTVAEQMLARLESRSPIAYFDVTREGVTRVDASAMRRRVERVATALLAVGIGRGDRVAIVGVNSSAYLAADAAIGLVGATSVPLYYTLPAEEATFDAGVMCGIAGDGCLAFPSRLSAGAPQCLATFYSDPSCSR